MCIRDSAYADGETTYEALRDVPFDGDGDPPAVADGEPRHWRRAEVPPVRKVVIDVDGLVERDVPIRRTGKPMRHHPRYASATTAREYVSLGGSTADLKYDLVNGFFVEDAPAAEALKLREEVAQLMQENEQLKAHKASKTPHPAPEPEAPTEAPKPKRRQLGVLGWRVVPVDAAAWEALGSDEAEGTWLEALL